MKNKYLQLLNKLLMYSFYGIVLQMFLVTFMLAGERGKAQNSVKEVILTIKFDSENLESVFQKIEAKTDFNFAFKHKDLDKNFRLSRSYIDKSLYDILLDISKEARLGFERLNESIGVKKLQKRKRPVVLENDYVREVTGTVNDENGVGLPGVNILVKGTISGVVTDSEGKYAIEVSDNAVLVFSSIGYLSEEIAVDNRSVIDVTLIPDIQHLSEVIVTAFGLERKKKALGYSAQEISGDELAVARETNLASSLKGKVAGVFVNSSSGGPGGSTSVIIRGSSSLTGNNQPLYVVDGMPMNNTNLGAAGIWGGSDYGDGIGNINPDDVESMTVLKGPNAASLYGSRGANGVILITTKKGKKNSAMNITFNTNATFETPNIRPSFQNKWGGGYDDDYSAWGVTTIDGVEYPLYTGFIDNWGPAMDGTLIVMRELPELGPVPYTAQPEDNYLELLETGKTLTNTIDFSGGNENTNYRLSLSDMSNRGIAPNSSLDRQNISLRLGTSVNDKLSFDGKVNYIRQKGENRPQVGGNFLNNVTNLQLIARHVNLDWLKDYKKPDGSIVNYKRGFPINPYWVINEVYSEDQRDRMIGFVSVNYKITDWLSVSARTGTDLSTDTRFERIAKETPGGSNRSGVVQNLQFRTKEENSDVMVTAASDLSNNFHGSFSMGANHFNQRIEATGSRGTNLNIDGLYHISNAQNVVPTYSLIRKQINSVFFTGQLAYKNYLFLDITGRNDWSSTLGVNNHSFFYPSFSLGFALTDVLEIDSKILTFGKLRASYAQAGNDADPYRTIGGYSLLSSDFNGQGFAEIDGTIPLLDLKNELTSSYEIGTDLRFFNNRLGVDFTYYNSSTTNQILPVQISGSSGYTNRIINAGEIKNKGIELFIHGTPVSLENSFKWDLSFNFARNRSEVVSLTDGVESQILLDASGATIEARPGEPYGNIVGFPYRRTDDGRKLLTPAGQFQRGTDRVILGNIQPDWLGGFTNTFHFKGISLSALIDIRKGGEIYSMSKQDQMAKGTGKFTEERENLVADGVIENADGTFTQNTQEVVSHNFYAIRAWNNIGEEFVASADYVSLREVTLGYEFKPKFLSATPIKKARISFVGRNLFYIHRDPIFELMGTSPETAFNTSSAAQGLEGRSAPTYRSLGFNLTLSF